MFITINGARLYFDVENSGLVADGAKMRSKPPLILLHGGPGADHTIYKPAFAALGDCAQIIYLDHRGNGRSTGDDPATWNLAQWADDLKSFCDVLGIEKPIVFGASFGGFVAQAYATRHPDHPAKLILASTAAKIDFSVMFDAFGRRGGTEARTIAEAHWTKPTAETRARFFKVCLPLYTTRSTGPPDWLQRAIVKSAVALHFNGMLNELGRMDFRAALARVACPTLVLAGDCDPVMPMPFSEVIAASLPRHLVQFERFTNCGHGIIPDEPERAFQIIRAFIAKAP